MCFQQDLNNLNAQLDPHYEAIMWGYATVTQANSMSIVMHLADVDQLVKQFSRTLYEYTTVTAIQRSAIDRTVLAQIESLQARFELIRTKLTELVEQLKALSVSVTIH